MSYKINDIDFSMFGITPIRGNEPVALTGFLDFPGREGTTERDWGTETEAFVSAADLEWKERKLTFTRITSYNVCYTKLLRWFAKSKDYSYKELKNQLSTEAMPHSMPPRLNQ